MAMSSIRCAEVTLPALRLTEAAKTPLGEQPGLLVLVDKSTLKRCQ